MKLLTCHALALTAASALVAIPPAGVRAQTAPQIVLPPSNTQKPAPPKTLGGKPPAGRMLTRDELRVCMKRLDDVNASTKELERQRGALDTERDELSKGGEALKAERAEVEAKAAEVKAWQDRMRAHGAAVEAFNQRMKSAESAPREQREQLAKELEAERERLTQARTPLAEEEARLVPVYQNAVKAYNDKAQARDAKVDDWNTRNRAVNERAARQEAERGAWLNECANRPYREDDEIAIRRGQ